MYVDIKQSQISYPVNRYIIIPSQYCLWPFLKSQRAYRTDEQAFFAIFPRQVLLARVYDKKITSFPRAKGKEPCTVYKLPSWSVRTTQYLVNVMRNSCGNVLPYTL